MATQTTSDWEDRYRTGSTAWEDAETAPATRALVLQHAPPGCSILDIGCGRGVDSVWLAEQGYRVCACDVSATAIRDGVERAGRHAVTVDFRVADFLQQHHSLPRCDIVFDRGVFHTFMTDKGRAGFARVVAEYLQPEHLWLSISGAAATPGQAEEAARRLEPRLSASQLTAAVEPFFEIVSVTRTRYGFPGGVTDFPAFASVLRSWR